MPRTPDQSASSALRTTSVYQRSKSSDILVTSLTKSCCSSACCFMRSLPCSINQLGSIRPDARERAGLTRERRRRGVLGSDQIDLSQQHGKQLFLGHGLVELTFLENHALAAAAGDADVGVARLGRAVHHAAH